MAGKYDVKNIDPKTGKPRKKKKPVARGTGKMSGKPGKPVAKKKAKKKVAKTKKKQDIFARTRRKREESAGL